MAERFSNEINQGLRIKQALREKFENITVALILKLETYLQSTIDFNHFKPTSSVKSAADHFIDGGWVGTSKAIFILNDGWTLELTSGRYATLQNDKLGFTVGSGEHQGGTVYNPPTVFKCPSSVAQLYKIDNTLDSLLLTIYDRIIPLQKWFDDLKVRM
jgi:hypothetical protein